jgi:hypothetical protein
MARAAAASMRNAKEMPATTCLRLEIASAAHSDWGEREASMNESGADEAAQMFGGNEAERRMGEAVTRLLRRTFRFDISDSQGTLKCCPNLLNRWDSNNVLGNSEQSPRQMSGEAGEFVITLKTVTLRCGKTSRS